MPPTMAPVLFVLLSLGDGSWAFVLEEMLDSGDGVVLGLLACDVSGRVGCAVLSVVVTRGLDGEVVEEVGVDEEEGLAVVVKAKYSFVLVPLPQAR